MKTRRSWKFITTAAIVAAMLGGGLLTPEVDAASPYGRAAGKSKGSLTGKATGIGAPIKVPKTPAIAKMPRKTGKCWFKIQGFPKLVGKVKTAKLRQGGKKVVQKGTIRVPASQTMGLGTIRGPFNSVITLNGKPVMKAKTSFSPGFGVQVIGKFVGT